MKKNLEEMQVKVANKRAILESHDGEEFSPITVAKNVLCEDGTTMQDYFDNHSEPNISTKIVNSNSMSKVGQGDNVDFSDNVMNGAYEDVVLKGKSLVNVIQGSSKDKVVLPYSFEEGETVTINDTHTNGRVEVEVKGRTLVNLVLEYNISNRYLRTPLNHPVVFGRQYLVRIFNCPINFKGVAIHNKKATYQYTYIPINKPWTSNNSNATYDGLELDLLSDDNIQLTDEEKENIRILFVEYQEGMENWDIPYFEGMASVQAPTVQTVGKNLFYGEVVNDKNIDGNTGEVGAGNRTIPVNFISVKPNTIHTFTRPVSNGNVGIRYYSKNQNYLGTTSFVPANGIATFTFTTPIGCYFLKFIDEANTLDNNYQIEEGSTATTYEHYQSSSFTLPEEIVLRSLPNGVCDTYNTKTKEYTQRIGEATYTGEDIELWKESVENYESDDIDSFFTYIYTPYAPINSKHCNCNLFPTYNSLPLKPTFEYFHILNTGQAQIVVGIKRSKLSTQNLTGFKQWLSQNPLTIQYELATPIITKIDLPSLKAYNTITHLSSTVGDGSLVPTLASDHTVDYSVVIKPNTKYSIVAHKDCNYHTTNLNYTFDLGGATTTCSVNDTITTVTTPTTLSHQELRVKGQGLAISSIRVIEGEVAQDLPYFEGICDVKSPVIHNVDTIEETDSRKINTTTFTSNDDEIIVLRSLPNGVCDTLNVKTGEYVQIIGEITLDGTKRDDLVYHTVLKDNDGDFIRMIINGCSFYDNNKYGNCDKLPFYHEEKTKDSVEAVFPFAGEKHFYIKIKTSRINGAETMENNSSQLRDAFLNWLAQNPITVQYELATPIVKQVNVEGYPYAYENGHILLESGSQEQSLTPTIEYSIVANRGGQIRSNQRMVERHQKKLDSLYAMTLVNMIDSQYKQVLMKLKSDLGSEVTSWDI